MFRRHGNVCSGVALAMMSRCALAGRTELYRAGLFPRSLLPRKAAASGGQRPRQASSSCERAPVRHSSSRQTQASVELTGVWHRHGAAGQPWPCARHGGRRGT